MILQQAQPYSQRIIKREIIIEMYYNPPIQRGRLQSNVIDQSTRREAPVPSAGESIARDADHEAGLRHIPFFKHMRCAHTTRTGTFEWEHWYANESNICTHRRYYPGNARGIFKRRNDNQDSGS